MHTVPSRVTYAHNYQLKYKYRNPSAYHRSLGPDECPEFVYDPDAYNKAPSWICLPCWRPKDRLRPHSGFMRLPMLKQHVRTKLALSELTLTHSLLIVFPVDMGSTYRLKARTTFITNGIARLSSFESTEGLHLRTTILRNRCPGTQCAGSVWFVVTNRGCCRSRPLPATRHVVNPSVISAVNAS